MEPERQTSPENQGVEPVVEGKQPTQNNVGATPVSTGFEPTSTVEPRVNPNMAAQPMADLTMPTPSVSPSAPTSPQGAASVQPATSPGETTPSPSFGAAAEPQPAEFAPSSQQAPDTVGTPTVLTPQPTVGMVADGIGGQVVTFATAKRSRKPWILGGAAAGVVLLLLAGVVFGYYLPNTPDRVWSTGVGRTGKALSKLVSKAAEPKTIAQFEQSKMTLNASLKWGTYSGKLTWTGASDKTNTQGKIVASSTDSSSGSTTSDYNATIEYLAKYSETKQLPDFYFKLSDLKNISISDYSPKLEGYVNTWIFVSADALTQYAPNLSASVTDKDKRVTSQDIASAAKVVAETVQDYVLTSDTSKTVLAKKSFVGKETVDATKTYHYKAGINIEHAKAYCAVIVQKMFDTALYKKLQSDSSQTDQDKKIAVKDCQESMDTTLKESDTFEVWIDSGSKLIHKIRVPSEQGNTTTYTEFGQTYKGGDAISLFARYHDGGQQPYDVEWTLDTNMATGVTESKVTGKPAKASADDVELQVSFKSEPTTGKVDVTVPKDAVPITTILEALGVSGNGAGAITEPSLSTNRSKSADVRRQTDVAAIAIRAESFYAIHGFYPTLADIQDSGFVAKYMAGLSPSALRDPSQTTGTIQATTGQASASYAYVASGSGCNNTAKTTVSSAEGAPIDNGCEAFVVSAKLSTGELYAKKSY